SDCEATVRLWPERAVGYNCRGLAYKGIGDFAKALSSFDEAISHDAKFATAYYNKGMTFVSQNKLDDAIANFSHAVEINEKYDESYAQRGKVRMSKGDVANARADFDKALTINSHNFTAAVGVQAMQLGLALDALSKK